MKTEKQKTAELLKEMIDEGKKKNHNLEYSVLQIYLNSLGVKDVKSN